MVRKRFKKKIILALVAALAVLGSVGFSPEEVHANAVDQITLKVGYYGWDPSEYITKATFSDGDLRGMSSVESVYSYFDGTTRVAIDSARGVSMATVLDAAGIDQGSISSISFYTADSGSGAYRTMTMQELLLANRYYFNDLAAHISRDENGNIVADDDVWNSATYVSTMLAYEESWVWYNIGTSGAGPNWTSLSTQNRFRLNFGQQYPLETETSASAKMVHTMYIMFSGTPSLTADKTNISGKVGSTHKVKVTAASVDEDISRKLNQEIQYSSSDESVAKVDENGNVTIVGKGNATITASAGGASVQIAVGEDKGGKGDGNGSGSGKGGKGKKPSKNPKSDSDKEIDASIRAYALSDDANSRLKVAFSKEAASEQASMSTYQEEMDKDAEQLEIEKKSSDKMMLGVGAFAVMTAGLGAIYGAVSFKRKMGYAGKVQRIKDGFIRRKRS